MGWVTRVGSGSPDAATARQPGRQRPAGYGRIPRGDRSTGGGLSNGHRRVAAARCAGIWSPQRWLPSRAPGAGALPRDLHRLPTTGASWRGGAVDGHAACG